MFSLQDTMKFVNINQNYLKYLHDACNEVYYKPIDYESKPYLGILLSKDNQQYIIPLSSAKEKHKAWKNEDATRFLVFETCQIDGMTEKDIYTDNGDGSVKHILSVLDIKKMIPVKDGLYSEVDINSSADDSEELAKYKILLKLEFSFCLKIMDSIIQKTSKVYDKQIETGKIIPFCCDFKLLEEKCKAW